jgi:hypothetical protein
MANETLERRPSWFRSSAFQYAIQVVRRAERKMREGLWKIAQSFALLAGLFRVKSEMIGISQHVFEQQPCSALPPARTSTY